MEASLQNPYSVATIEGGKKEKRDYMLRVRLSPIERYELNVAAEKQQLNESATIRWLIKHYPDIKSGENIINKFRAAEESEKALKETLGV